MGVEVKADVLKETQVVTLTLRLISPQYYSKVAWRVKIAVKFPVLPLERIPVGQIPPELNPAWLEVARVS